MAYNSSFKLNADVVKSADAKDNNGYKISQYIMLRFMCGLLMLCKVQILIQIINLSLVKVDHKKDKNRRIT